MATEACVVYVTCSSETEAETLARGLVEEKHAACVNLVPAVTSFYVWEETLQRDSELLLIIKTTIEKLGVLTEYIQSHHSYTVPEVIALPVVGGSQSYLDWVNQSVS